MKIAGVSVNIENLPTKQEIIRAALNTKAYQNEPNAIELINNEIKKSGLFRNIPNNVKTPSKPNKPSGKR